MSLSTSKLDKRSDRRFLEVQFLSFILIQEFIRWRCIRLLKWSIPNHTMYTIYEVWQKIGFISILNQNWSKITLKAIAILRLLANNIENRVDQLGTFGIVTFGPIVAGSWLSEDEVIRAKDLSKRAGSDAVHGAGFKIHENGPRDVPAAGGLIVIDVDPLELKIGGAVALVPSGGVNAVLVADDLPELGADLVAALASLNVKDLSHCCRRRGERKREKERRGRRNLNLRVGFGGKERPNWKRQYP